MSKLLDYLTNNNNATPVNASFEVQAQETPGAIAPANAVPVVTRGGKRYKRIGKPTGQPAVSAQGKTLTVVASSQKKSLIQRIRDKKAANAGAPKKVGLFKRIKANRANNAGAPKKGGLFKRIKANRANNASAPKKTPIRNFIKKPGVKKAATVAAFVAAPMAAGAFLAIKNRKAIAGGAKKVFKKIGRRR